MHLFANIWYTKKHLAEHFFSQHCGLMTESKAKVFITNSGQLKTTGESMSGVGNENYSMNWPTLQKQRTVIFHQEHSL